MAAADLRPDRTVSATSARAASIRSSRCRRSLSDRDSRSSVSAVPRFQFPTIQVGTDFDVDEAGPSAPHDDVSRRRIVGAREIAAEPGNLGEILRKVAVGLWRRSSNRGDPINYFDLVIGKDKFGRCVGRGAVDHRHPEQSPCHDAEDGDEVDETLGGPLRRGCLI